ncbi:MULTISPECIES: non-heme iron oxygenase ferredoxin subunit [Deinococcus]|uniref:non-heme iron oxygenase ferredoxin subunit n=1 Tax=Deinococcus TaxID=1298 RepID=UPI0004821CA0|nr:MULTISPECIES: non-heme iron oxygenase ferredoxin subunit [Deinococcus]KEF35642.1 ferredoxin [Deinococcus sp. RL]
MSEGTERVRVGREAELPEGSQTEVTVGGQSVVVVRYEGEFYALRNNCTHKDFPLLGGEVSDGRITCTKHGAKFELATGKAKALPAVKPVRIYRTVREAGEVFVEAL